MHEMQVVKCKLEQKVQNCVAHAQPAQRRMATMHATLHTRDAILRFALQHRPCTSDVQKWRHLQKSRVTEKHNRGTKRKLKSHQGQQKGALPLFWVRGCDFSFRFVRRLCRSATRLFCKRRVFCKSVVSLCTRRAGPLSLMTRKLFQVCDEGVN